MNSRYDVPTGAWRLVLLLMAAAMIVAHLLFPFALGGVGASAQDSQHWVCDPKPWLAGNRIPDFHGDLGGAATSLPDGPLAMVASDVKNRMFRLWMYDGSDHQLDVPFSAVQLENGTSLPTGRIDPQGAPILLYNGGMLKIFFKAFNPEGGDQPLIRVYTWCGLTSP